MIMSSPPESTAAERLDREGITLQELKQQLNFVAPASTAPLTPQESGKLESCIEGFLMRFLRSKHLSVSEAASKLRRRRVFESTLPAITITPSVVACLRSGALRIIGRDLEQRLVLFFDARQLQAWPALSTEDAERLIVLLCLYMEHRCMQCVYESPVAGSPTAKSESSASYRFRQQMILVINAHDVPATRVNGGILRHVPAVQPIVSKYFPNLVDLVLIAGAGYEARHAVQAALAQSTPELQRAVQMLQDSDLTRFMDPSVIPSSLGGRNQGADQQLGGGAGSNIAVDLNAENDSPLPANAAAAPSGGVSSMVFAESVLRQWYLVTAFLSMESTVMHNQPECPHRPLYLPPPLQIMPPTTSLAVMMSDKAQKSAGSGKGVGPTGSSSDFTNTGTVRPVFPYFMAIPATVPSLTGLPQAVAEAHKTAIEDEETPLQGGGATVMKSSYTSRARNSSTRRHRVPRSPLPNAPAEDAARALEVDPTTVDDGLCSSLVSSTFVDPDDKNSDFDSELEDEDDEPVANAHAGHAAASKKGPASTAFGAAGADVDPAEADKIKNDPDYALRALRQERGRRLIAEQRVQLAQLGLTMDPHNASVVERELAGIHEELNVLVSEVLVRSREAAGSNVAPSLAQLLDVTVSVLESAVQESERVPVVTAFAQPVQRDEAAVDNAVGGGCCCTVM